jgi:D-lactate dehydrogenase
MHLFSQLYKQLIERPDVIVSPHIAFYTDAAVENLIVDALDATSFYDFPRCI